MTKNLELRWMIYKKEDSKFPYQLYIEEKPNQFLCLNVQERWPGPGKKIFCKPCGVFTSSDLPAEGLLVEFKIISIRRYGKRLTIVLDRKIKRRCWFVFVKKEYKNKPGEY